MIFLGFVFILIHPYTEEKAFGSPSFMTEGYTPSQMSHLVSPVPLGHKKEKCKLNWFGKCPQGKGQLHCSADLSLLSFQLTYSLLPCWFIAFKKMLFLLHPAFLNISAGEQVNYTGAHTGTSHSKPQSPCSSAALSGPVQAPNTEVQCPPLGNNR